MTDQTQHKNCRTFALKKPPKKPKTLWERTFSHAKCWKQGANKALTRVSPPIWQQEHVLTAALHTAPQLLWKSFGCLTCSDDSSTANHQFHNNNWSQCHMRSSDCGNSANNKQQQQQQKKANCKAILMRSQLKCFGIFNKSRLINPPP